MKPNFELDKIRLFNCDCMAFMAEIPDNYYELAIVDPPYGIGMDGGNVGYKGKNNLQQKSWDIRPAKEYFVELFRISNNQIIWGGNYFIDFLYPTRCFIVWDKGEGFKDRAYAEGELAWTSFDKNLKIYKRDPLAKRDYHNKISPCQKPIQLYKWLLTNYAKPNDKVFDSHGGSFSSACAALDMGFEFDGCELDKDYFDSAVDRVMNHSQLYLDI